ncbi:MAG: hypothetical protein WA919_17550 [Coleofasciculaceae cyanobacterium]
MKLRVLLANVLFIFSFCWSCSGSSDCSNSPLADIALSYLEAQENDQALEITQAIDKPASQVRLLTKIAVEYARTEQKGQAEALFNQALQIVNQSDLPIERAVKLEEIAQQYGKAGQKAQASQVLSQALQVADNIWGASFIKDTVLERIAVRYAEIGDFEQGIQVAETIVGNIPQSRALGQIALKYAETGNYPQARELAQTIESKDSQAIALARIEANTGKYQAALKAAQQIEDIEHKSIILAQLAILYEKAQQLEPAMDILSHSLEAARGIEQAPNQAEQLAKIARIYLELGEREQAIEIFSLALQTAQEIETIGKKVQTLTTISTNLAQAGQKEQAESSFNQGLQIAQTFSKEENQQASLANLAIISAQIKTYNQVLEVIPTIVEESTTQVGVLREIAHNYAEAGQREQANQVLTEALQIAQSLENPEAKAQNLAHIAFEYAKIEDYGQAIALTNTIGATGHESIQASSLAKIGGLYAQDQQKDKAIELLSQARKIAKQAKCST